MMKTAEERTYIILFVAFLCACSWTIGIHLGKTYEANQCIERSLDKTEPGD